MSYLEALITIGAEIVSATDNVLARSSLRRYQGGEKIAALGARLGLLQADRLACLARDPRRTGVGLGGRR